MTRKILLTIIFCLTMCSPVLAAPGVQWKNLTDGMAQAKLENKPMIIDYFFGKGCPRCEMLQKNVYDNPDISKKIMAEFVPIKIDLTKPLSKDEDALGKKYDYKNDCMLLFMDQDMNILKDPSGKKMCFVDNVEPEFFIKYLDQIKSGATKK